jgi:hypothetical protein
MILAEWMFRLPWMRRPAFLTVVSTCRPAAGDLGPCILILEIRDGHLKWAHLLCPKCNDHIELPMAGRGKWTIKIDWFRRPTLSPSIWEKATCGAHFFIRSGEIRWALKNCDQRP